MWQINAQNFGMALWSLAAVDIGRGSLPHLDRFMDAALQALKQDHEAPRASLKALETLGPRTWT